MPALLYQSTYEARDLNLMPGISGAQALFNGDLDLNASPSGEWSIADIWVDTVLFTPLGKASFSKERVPKDSLVYKFVEDAAESYDHWTRAIRDHVIDDLRDAASAEAADHRRHLMAAE